MILGMFIALLAGIFIATQGAVNGLAGNRVGIIATVIIPVFIQMIIYIVAMFANRQVLGGVVQIRENGISLYYLILSALLGIGIMATLTFSIMKIGPLIALAIVVLSQLTLSMVIEYFGWFEQTKQAITLNKLAGLLMFAMGIWLFVKK